MRKKLLFLTALIVSLLLASSAFVYASASTDSDEDTDGYLVNITRGQQYIVVGVNENGSVVFAGDTENFNDNYNNYCIVDNSQNPVDCDDYVEDTDQIARDQQAFERLEEEQARAEAEYARAEEERRNASQNAVPYEQMTSSQQQEYDIKQREERPEVIIDVRPYISSNGQFDFNQFAVNENLVAVEPVIEERKPVESDNNIWFRQEDLIEQKDTVIEPGFAEYDIEVEVGRIAHLFPTKATAASRKSADTSIIGDPYEYAEPGFIRNFRANAKAPGNTTITFVHETNHTVDFTETWNVRVFCRDLSFEQDQYVVQKSGKSPEYFTLNLKEFEYTVDFAYYFKWTSSNPEVATVSDNWMSTYANVCVKKAGVTTITVTDKFGNSRSTLLVVKPDSEVEAARLKAAVKASKVTASAKTYSGYTHTKITWKLTSTTQMDGYQVYYSADGGKTFKRLKTVTSPTTLYHKHKSGVSGQVYYYKVRGYRKINGKKVYTPFSEVIKKKHK